MSNQTNNTSFADYTISMMDHYINKPSYTVYEVTSNGMCFNSVFTTFKQAKAYSRKYTTLSSKVYIFKTSCVKCYEPETESEPDLEIEDSKVDSPAQVVVNPLYDFSSMIIKSYGRGYLLVPPKSNQYFGDKYFHNGWWIKKQSAWFFKKEHLEMLQEYGANFLDESCENLNTLAEAATEVSQTIHYDEHDDGHYDEHDDGHFDEHDDGGHDNYDDEQSDADTDYTPCENVEGNDTEKDDDHVDLSEMVFREYGKGYLVIPPSDNIHFGEKYFHDGWWIKKMQGWFFKQSEYHWLVDHGAIQLISDDEHEDENNNSNEDLSNMCFENYGKGYILYTTKNDPRFRQDYFLEGFWNKNKEGWFFQKKYFNLLEKRGAKYIKSEDDNVSLCSACTEESGDTITQNQSNRRVTRSQTKMKKVGNMHLVYDYDDDL